VPPYEGRKESAEPEQEGGSTRGGVKVGGATGPVPDDEFKAPDPAKTPGGRTASPGDEQPAADMPDGSSPEATVDAPAHTPGVARGEDGGA
jgi:hypothetical protein